MITIPSHLMTVRYANQVSSWMPLSIHTVFPILNKKTDHNVIQLRNEHKIAQRDFSPKKAKAFFWKNLKKYLTREKRGFYTIRRNYRRKKLL